MIKNVLFITISALCDTYIQILGSTAGYQYFSVTHRIFNYFFIGILPVE